MHYLCITTNIKTGQKYVGQRKCPKNITPEKDSYFGSGTRLLYAIKKYGKNSFKKEVLIICNSQKEIDEHEINYIKENNVLSNKELWYNIDAGGQYNRSENHSELTSKSMKKLYSTVEGKNAVIKGINKMRLKKGMAQLPYNNHNEYLKYISIKTALASIRKHNHKKLNKIRARKRKSKKLTWQLYILSDVHRDVVKTCAINAHKASMKPESIELRRQSQKSNWNKRKEKGNVWDNDNKKAFAVGKLKQYNNPIGLYLINQSVSLRISGLQKKIKKCYQQYKNENNLYKQIDNIITTIYNTQQILIDKEKFISIVHESRI